MLSLLTLYALTGRIRPVLPKFQNKKGPSKKFPKRAYIRLCPEKRRKKKNSGCKGLIWKHSLFYQTFLLENSLLNL